MEIRTIHRIIDDDGVECGVGDTVILQTKSMQEPVQATIDTIMTNMAVFIVDDKIMGYIPVKTRVTDIRSLTLHHRK